MQNAQAVLRNMKIEASPLIPLLRFRVQTETLAVVLLDPEREWSLTELA